MIEGIASRWERYRDTLVTPYIDLDPVEMFHVDSAFHAGAAAAFSVIAQLRYAILAGEVNEAQAAAVAEAQIGELEQRMAGIGARLQAAMAAARCSNDDEPGR
jgi:hypothetical protein